jgi:hypothetical protein
LRPLVPGEEQRATPPTPPSSAAPVFIALQASAISVDLEAFVADAANRRLLDDVVNRLRSLRGIAGVADHPPLGDIADAVEQALRLLPPDALLSDRDTELLNAAAALFRRASSDLRGRGRFDRSTPEVERFARAESAGAPAWREAEPIVHIEDLFFADAGPHVVQRGSEPGVTAEQRFAQGAIPLAEHLLRLLSDARGAGDAFSRDRGERELRSHLQRVEEFARSFGSQQVAAYFGDIARRRSLLDPATLETLERGARLLVSSGSSIDELERRLAVLERARQPVPAAARPRAPAPRAPGGASGKALKELLETSLDGLRALDEEPLSEPAPLEDDVVVPIDSLLYRGRAALQRAIEIRDALRRSGTSDPESLHELYDLLDLARAE